MLPAPGVTSSQESRAASDFTARRLLASAAVFMPSTGTPAFRSPAETAGWPPGVTPSWTTRRQLVVSVIVPISTKLAPSRETQTFAPPQYGSALAPEAAIHTCATPAVSA